MSMAERSSKAHCKAHGVRHMFRFKDGVVAESRQLNREFVRRYILSSREAYGVECVELGRVVTFLSVQISLEGRKFRMRPILKDSGPPLSSESVHPPGVRNWPCGHLKSLAKRCSSAGEFEAVRRSFTDHFRKNHAPTWLLDKLEAISYETATRSQTHTSGMERREANEKWLVLPHHTPFSVVPNPELPERNAKE